MLSKVNWAHSGSADKETWPPVSHVWPIHCMYVYV